MLFFFGHATPPVVEALAQIERCPLFDGDRALCVAVGNRPEDFGEGALPQSRVGHLYLLDGQGHGTLRYGLTSPVRPVAFVLSPAMQVIDVVALNDPSLFAAHIRSTLTSLLTNNDWESSAPVLIVPRVFDRPLCERLINLYDETGGREIGAIERKGEALKRFNPEFRKRLDYYIADEQAVIRCRELLATRLLPLVSRAFQFETTRIERWLVGCYDARTGGYFRPHRDNTAAINAHRRFALTINLNDGYGGGDLSSPNMAARYIAQRLVRPSYFRVPCCTRSRRSRSIVAMLFCRSSTMRRGRKCVLSCQQILTVSGLLEKSETVLERTNPAEQVEKRQARCSGALIAAGGTRSAAALCASYPRCLRALLSKPCDDASRACDVDP